MSLIARWRSYLDNAIDRDAFVIDQLARLPKGATILDAGAGSQRYRRHCGRLKYHAQDFAKYEADDKSGFAANTAKYEYGPLDYTGDIWKIDEKDGKFDAILCTEVLEHIPYPIAAISEFARLLKSGGTLILTAPSSCLRHMDPFFFYSGFSDRFFSRVLAENGFTLERLDPVGDYYRWIAVELYRTARAHSIFAAMLLFPSFVYYLCKRPTESSVNTLCMGYHLVAVKK